MVKVICDTNFLIHLATKRIKNIDNLDVEIGSISFIVPEVVKNELVKLQNIPEKNQEITTTLNFIKNFKTISIKGNYADQELINYVKNNRTIIATMDRELKNKIKQLKNLKIELLKISLDIDNNLDLHETLIKAKELGFYRIFLESGKKMTTSFLYKNLIDDLNLFVSDKNLVKNGENNIKEQLKLFLSDKKGINEKTNLFGEKLIKYKIK